MKRTKQSQYIDMIKQFPNFQMKEIYNIKIITYENPSSPGIPFQLIIFEKNRPKPSHIIRFGSPQYRDHYLAIVMNEHKRAFIKEQERLKMVEKEKEKYVPGKVLYGSWGYEQTNVNFYIILERKGNFLTLQEIGAKKRYVGGYSDRGEATPDPERKIGLPFRRKINNCGSVKIDSCVNVQLYDGLPKCFSSYA